MKHIRKYNESSVELVEKLNITHNDFYLEVLDNKNIIEFSDREKKSIDSFLSKLIYNFDCNYANVAFSKNSPRHPRLCIRCYIPHYSNGLIFLCFKDDDDYFWVNLRGEDTSYYKIDSFDGLLSFLNKWLIQYMPDDESIQSAKDRIIKFLQTATKGDIYKIDDFITNDINDI